MGDFQTRQNRNDPLRYREKVIFLDQILSTITQPFLVFPVMKEVQPASKILAIHSHTYQLGACANFLRQCDDLLSILMPLTWRLGNSREADTDQLLR
jgi:hypothetical protein